MVSSSNNNHDLLTITPDHMSNLQTRQNIKNQIKNKIKHHKNKKKGFQQLNDAEKKSSGVSDDLIRVSVGLENIDDIKADFEQAFNNI